MVTGGKIQLNSRFMNSPASCVLSISSTYSQAAARRPDHLHCRHRLERERSLPKQGPHRIVSPAPDPPPAAAAAAAPTPAPAAPAPAAALVKPLQYLNYLQLMFGNLLLIY